MNLEENRTEIIEERLTVKYNIDVWVEARARNSSCTSLRWSGVLEHAGTDDSYVDADHFSFCYLNHFCLMTLGILPFYSVVLL